MFFCNVGCIENEALVNVQGDIEIIRFFNKIISVYLFVKRALLTFI